MLARKSYIDVPIISDGNKIVLDSNAEHTIKPHSNMPNEMVVQAQNCGEKQNYSTIL